MKRKIIKQGSGAYTITLPIDWIRQQKLSEDSELDLTVSGKSLLINSNTAPQGGSIALDVSNFPDRKINFSIVALYAKGVDEIILTSKKDITPAIMKALSNLIGFALVEQEKGKYIIRDISGGNYPNLDEIFKRVFQMILLFYEAAVQDIFGEEKETLDNLRTRDAEVNKFCFYLQRAINKLSYQDNLNGRIMFTYSYSLEKISDEIERAWRTNIKYGIKKSKALKDLVLQSKEVLEKCFDLYYISSPSTFDETYSLREKVRERSLIIPKTDASTTRFIRHIVKISEDAADLNHLTLMRKL